MLRKKILATTFVLFSLIFMQATLNVGIMSVSATMPSQLKIYAGPTSIPADNHAYTVIDVQLQDSKALPARATQDTTIYLSSSATNVATVDSTMTIKQGATSATATVYTTYTPGSTMITAAASGYMTVQTSITTVGPLPSTVAVYGFPPTLPADGRTYQAVIVQLQDSTSTPAKAPINGVTVTLSSSNTNVGAVDPSVFIPAGTTYAIASFATSYNPGIATITPVASGYLSKTAKMTTEPAVTSPLSVQLGICVAPTNTAADGNTYPQVAVQLLDPTGKITTLPYDTTVTLSSSIIAVGTVDSSLTIPAGQTYAVANFKTTYMSGSTTITAAATNCAPYQAQLSTVGPIPTQIAIYGLPSALQADNQPYNALQVQLQDSTGKPAKDPVGDVVVYLFSSAPDAGTVDATLTIPFGQTQATGTFYANYIANSATITAQASGYKLGQTKITTYLIDPVFLNSTVSSDSDNILAGAQTNVTAFVAYNGSDPATKATVSFTSNKGGAFSTTTEVGNGIYSAVFTAPRISTSTSCIITASAAKTGYNTTTGNVQITITAPEPTPTPMPTATPTPTPSPTPTPTPTPSPTPTRTPTITPTPTSAPTPTTTPTPTPHPTNTPSPKPATTSTLAPVTSNTPTETPTQPTASPDVSSTLRPTSSTPTTTPSTLEANAASPIPAAAIYALVGVVTATVAVAVLFFLRKKL
jgi:hypothetical protein